MNPIPRPTEPKPYDCDIAIDCDGVLADLVGATLDHLKFYGCGVKPEDVTEYFFQREPNLEVFKPLIDDLWKSKNFVLGIKPYCNTVEFIKEMKRFYKIKVVTSPYPGAVHWQSERLRWLSCLYGIRQEDVVFTDDKTTVRAKVFLDDKPEHIVEYRAAHPDSTIVLVSHTYNLQKQVPCDMVARPTELSNRSQFSMYLHEKLKQKRDE